MSDYIFEEVTSPKIIPINLFINENFEFKLSPDSNIDSLNKFKKKDNDTLKLSSAHEIHRYYRHNDTGKIYFVSHINPTEDENINFFNIDISSLQHIIDGSIIEVGEITKIYKDNIFLKDALYNSTDGNVYSPFFIQKYGIYNPFEDPKIDDALLNEFIYNINDSNNLFNIPNGFVVNIPTDIYILGDISLKTNFGSGSAQKLIISNSFQNIKTKNIYVNPVTNIQLSKNCFSNISNLNEINSVGEEVLSDKLNLFLNGEIHVFLHFTSNIWGFNNNNIIFEDECMYNFLGNIYVRVSSIRDNIAGKINVFKNDVNNDYDLNLIFENMDKVNRGFNFNIPEGTFYGRKFRYYIINDVATIINNRLTIGSSCNSIGDSAFKNTEIEIIQFKSSINNLQLDGKCFSNGINNINSNIIFERPVVLNGSGIFSNCSMKTLHFKNNNKIIIKQNTFSNTTFNQTLNDNEFNIIFDDTTVRNIECDVGAFANIDKCKIYVGYNNFIINEDSTINDRNITIITSFKNKRQFITNFGEFNINIKIIAIDALYYFINPDTTKEIAINNYESKLGTEIENQKPSNYDDYLENYINYKNFNRNYFRNRNIINIYHLYDLMDNNL